MKTFCRFDVLNSVALVERAREVQVWHRPARPSACMKRDKLSGIGRHIVRIGNGVRAMFAYASRRDERLAKPWTSAQALAPGRLKRRHVGRVQATYLTTIKNIGQCKTDDILGNIQGA